MNINLTLFGQTITFAIFVWFCLKFIWPPIVKALEERRQRIAEGLAAAERGKQEQELAEKRAKEVLVGAKDQVGELIAQANKRADEIVEESKTTARAEGERLLAAARSEIEQEVNRARESLRAEVARLALAGAQQVLEREVDQAAHDDLLKKLTAQL